jgi:pectin methylesterase-like acyl-CoA thioesterase
VPANKPLISFIGENEFNTIITYDNYAGKTKPEGGTYGTTGSSSVFVDGPGFTAENITFENSFDESSTTVSGKQAVAIKVQADRSIFKYCRFIGNQDTLYANAGRQYYYRSYIEGDVDFIFGGATAVFDDNEIFSLTRGSSSNNGYIAAPSTQISIPYGYLFINSKLLSNAPAGTVYLGRPWHPGGDPDAIGNAVFKHTYMGAHINPVGWTDMSGFKAADARFYEYRNSGAGSVINASRRQLSDTEAAKYTVENVLKGSDNWNPKGEDYR